MVIAGKKSPKQASRQEVAERTVKSCVTACPFPFPALPFCPEDNRTKMPRHISP